MTISLHAALLPSFIQILESVRGLVTKAQEHCVECSSPEADIVGARLAEDMLPFAYQVKSAIAHSLGAIEGVRAGNFSPDLSPPPASFAELTEPLDAAIAALKAIDPAEVDGFVGRDMQFSMRDMVMPFTAENFLLSFSQPNFYFHATTAYAILRSLGVKLGKRDFLGHMRLKVPA